MGYDCVRICILQSHGPSCVGFALGFPLCRQEGGGNKPELFQVRPLAQSSGPNRLLLWYCQVTAADRGQKADAKRCVKKKNLAKQIRDHI